MQNRLKVLTLGWEFPPLYAGGLGPACHGLTKALSQYADVSVILPKSDQAFKMNNVEIIGLNHHYRMRESTGQVAYKNMQTVETSLTSVYPVGNTFALSEMRRPDFTWDAKSELFNENDLYGKNIMKKVEAFSQGVCELGRKENFDVIHAHDWITFPAAVKLKKLTRKPLVVHVHSLETDRVDIHSRNAVYAIEKMGMEQANYILPVSGFTRSNIMEHYHIHKNKIVPVYNGYDSDFSFHGTQKEPKEKTRNILFLGRITAQKGPDYLVETVSKLLKRMSNVKVYVAGTGDLLPHLEWRVEQLGMRDKFVFTGFLNKNQVKDLLARTDAYIMPSVSEPFGLSAIEAAQFNIPCILSRQSGAAEVMPHTLQADYWDTDKMAGYLYAALNYKGLSDTLTGKSRTVIPSINWDRAAIKVMTVYRMLMSLN